MVVSRYSSERKEVWDKFVADGKNATFLFQRDYMDYHANRFTDYSLLIEQDSRLVGALPANQTSDGVVVSHQGLTFGGLVLRPTSSLIETLEILRASLKFLCQRGIERLVYKRIPRFYNTGPDDEVDYALFLLDARLVRRDCALVVLQQNRLPFRKGRKSEISKARRFGVRIVEDTDFAPFWGSVLIPRLTGRYGVMPVHSLTEITFLASRFPNNIRQFSAYCGDSIMAGATIYETPLVAHAQYSAVTDEGRKVGALDSLYAWLICERYKDKKCFDFGTSNENEGRALNHGLLDWKEAFGARTCAHDYYELLTANHSKLDTV